MEKSSKAYHHPIEFILQSELHLNIVRPLPCRPPLLTKTYDWYKETKEASAEEIKLISVEEKEITDPASITDSKSIRLSQIYSHYLLYATECMYLNFLHISTVIARVLNNI